MVPFLSRILVAEAQERILHNVPSAFRVTQQASRIAHQRRLILFKDRLQPFGPMAVLSVIHGFPPGNRNLLQEQRSNLGFLRFFRDLFTFRWRYACSYKMNMYPITLRLLVASILLGLIAQIVWRRRPNRSSPLLWAITVPAALLLACAAYSFWYHHRPLPEPLTRELFHGITYRRETRTDPRPLVLHILEIDLDAHGIGFTVTPPNPTGGRVLAGMTTSQFLEESGVQLAINAGPFRPWFAKGPLAYYPHIGDPVDPLGLTMHEGKTYNATDNRRPTLFITRDNRVSLGGRIADAYNAVTGMSYIVRQGKPIELYKKSPDLAPRTAIGLNETKRMMIVLIVDGRQPNYSEGVRMYELCQMMVELGAHSALNMDGGGSTTLVCEGDGRRAVVMNSPIHGRVPPGRQRPIATHLGIFAKRKPSLP